MGTAARGRAFPAGLEGEKGRDPIPRFGGVHSKNLGVGGEGRIFKPPQPFVPLVPMGSDIQRPRRLVQMAGMGGFFKRGAPYFGDGRCRTLRVPPILEGW